MINFTELKSIYNTHIDYILANDGLTTECVLSFGDTKRNICPNCIFDVNLKKSSNQYKSGGPIPFTYGQLCPYCNGIGYYGETNTQNIFIAIIWDYKKWINTPATNIMNPEGYIQTICKKELLSSLRKAKYLDVIYPGSNNKYQRFQLYAEPTPGGLGDNNYLITMWKKIN